MSNRNAEKISGEIYDKMIKRSELLNSAREILIKELTKNQALTFTEHLKEKTIEVEGLQYGKAVLDLNHWFGLIRDADPVENLARDMMDDLKNQLLPERDYSM